MNNIVTYLESKEVVFHGALILILLYVPHAGHLFMQLERIDMSLMGFTFFNWIYAISLAAVIELLILVFIINGYDKIGKTYALISFFINLLYYDYWFLTLQEPSMVNVKLTVTSLLICSVHSLSVWQLSELFHKRIRADKEKVVEYWCDECNLGPFPNKRSLDGHISRAHKYVRKNAGLSELLNGSSIKGSNESKKKIKI